MTTIALACDMVTGTNGSLRKVEGGVAFESTEVRDAGIIQAVAAQARVAGASAVHLLMGVDLADFPMGLLLDHESMVASFEEAHGMTLTLTVCDRYALAGLGADLVRRQGLLQSVSGHSPQDGRPLVAAKMTMARQPVFSMAPTQGPEGWTLRPFDLNDRSHVLAFDDDHIGAALKAEVPPRSSGYGEGLRKALMTCAGTVDDAVAELLRQAGKVVDADHGPAHGTGVHPPIREDGGHEEFRHPAGVQRCKRCCQGLVLLRDYTGAATFSMLHAEIDGRDHEPAELERGCEVCATVRRLVVGMAATAAGTIGDAGADVVLFEADGPVYAGMEGAITDAAGPDAALFRYPGTTADAVLAGMVAALRR